MCVCVGVRRLPSSETLRQHESDSSMSRFMMVTADLGQSSAKATNSEEEEVCGRAATETGVGSPLPAWSTTAPVELVVNNICTCVHGVGQCRGSPIGSGQGQMPGSSAPGSLPHWLIESQTSNWRCEAEGLRVALCSSSE